MVNFLCPTRNLLESRSVPHSHTHCPREKQMALLKRLELLTLLLLRCGLALVFIYHGYPKLCLRLDRMQRSSKGCWRIVQVWDVPGALGRKERGYGLG